MDIRRKAAHRKLGVSGGHGGGGGGGGGVELEGQRVIVSILSRTKGPEQQLPPPSFDRTIGISADSRAARAESETSTRSSTPATDASNNYPPSTSSLATSAPLEGECGFPPDDEADSCGSKCKWNQWDEDRPSPPPAPRDRPRSLDGDKMRTRGDSPAQNSQVASLIRQSQLRNSVSAASTGSDLDSDATQSDAEGDDCEEDEEDNDWSGENDSLDATVIAAVDGDLSLAAFLIPLLHRDFHSTVRNKIESWQYAAVSRATNSASGDGHSSSPTGPPSDQQSPGTSRKRRRRTSSGEDDRMGDGEDGEDGDGRGSGQVTGQPDASPESQVLLLACPFHKLSPTKYNIQHNRTGKSGKDYRSCAGPGFKSIQRLKEHLKRVHSPVQCDRCYQLFTGSDRPTCISLLETHRRNTVSCPMGDSSLKEGISDAQWASLDKQNRKKNQEKHRVEKWFEIWKILFPENSPPDTPWYPLSAMGFRSSTSSTRETDRFTSLFSNMLDHKLQQGDISFSDEQHDMKERLVNLVRQSFEVFRSLHNDPSRTDTSSSRTNLQPSLLGGSSTQPSGPANSTSQPMTGTSLSSAPVQQQPPATATYTLSMTNTTPYAVAAIPMNRQPSRQYQPPMPAPVPGGVAMANFPAMPQDELNAGYYLPVVYGQPWSTGVPYPAMPQAFNPATHMQSEYYTSQTENYGSHPGPDGDFTNLP